MTTRPCLSPSLWSPSPRCGVATWPARGAANAGSQFSECFACLTQAFKHVPASQLNSCRMVCVLDRLAKSGSVVVGRFLERCVRCPGCGASAATPPPSRRILHHTRSVFLNQLSAWCLRGLLVDPHGEFFVQRTAVGAAHAPAGDVRRALLAAARGIDGGADDGVGVFSGLVPLRVARRTCCASHLLPT